MHLHTQSPGTAASGRPRGPAPAVQRTVRAADWGGRGDGLPCSTCIKHHTGTLAVYPAVYLSARGWTCTTGSSKSMSYCYLKAGRLTGQTNSVCGECEVAGKCASAQTRQCILLYMSSCLCGYTRPYKQELIQAHGHVQQAVKRQLWLICLTHAAGCLGPR